MPITFTPNLEQTFRANSFGTEKTHVKQLSVQLVASTAFKNPLATVLAALVTQIDVQIAALTTDIAVATAEATTAQGYIDGTLPAGWDGAGYDDDDMADVKVAINAYVTRATASKTNNTTFKKFFYVIYIVSWQFSSGEARRARVRARGDLVGACAGHEEGFDRRRFGDRRGTFSVRRRRLERRPTQGLELS